MRKKRNRRKYKKEIPQNLDTIIVTCSELRYFNSVGLAHIRLYSP